jgi:flavin reductase (DIM6/NTAB) family NADH-FMN oxidoreductase RutF
MNFDLENSPKGHAYKLLIGLVAPRPIALITSMNEKGRLNAAPFSAYNFMGSDPPLIVVGVANKLGDGFQPKDTARNIRRTREFVVNVVTEDIAQQAIICSIDFPEEENELEAAGFTTAPSSKIKVPRIAQAHAALECVEHSSTEIGRTRIILGRVVAIYVEDCFVDPAGPYIKAEDLHAVGRMQGMGYYVKTRDAYLSIPRTPYADWKKSHPEN